MKRILSLLGLGLILISFGSLGNPFGLPVSEPIGPFLNGAFPDLSPTAGSWTAENAFPNLTFPDPIALQELPDQSGYLVAGKQGYLWWISNDNNSNEKIISLDISEEVITGEDAGFINFILHPEFGSDSSPNKGFLYLMYAHHPTLAHGNEPRMNRLSRFYYDKESKTIDPGSEFVLVQDYDPQGYHMGGGMFFDNQGFLNFTVGDGGATSDGNFFDSAQQIDQRHWGGLFRIDVDQNPDTSHPIRRQPIEYPGKPLSLPETFTQGYFIPNDNPWQDPEGGILEEFFALGLRSPHRASYDPIDEQIWVGDVGNGAREEITILQKGSNAQWPYKEGNLEGETIKPQAIIGFDTGPKFDYVRSTGVAVIGGFVYRGELWSHILDGYYLFGDHSNGNIWSLNPITEEVEILASIPKIGAGGKTGISSFATNAVGEIFILNLYGMNQDGGTIFRLKLNQEPPAYIPEMLSETGAFENLLALKVINGIIPYKSNSPLWSDGAEKKRWVGIPNDGSHNSTDEQVVFSEHEHWQFPPGTVFIKHFELPIDENNPDITRRLETRFYIVDKESKAYGITYKWNDAGTDAELLNTELIESYEIKKADGTTENQSWNYPNRLQCNSCHTANSGFVLGVKTSQLNSDLDYPGEGVSNQLSYWDNLGIFSNSISEMELENLAKSAHITDENYSEEHRVMSYLDANCSHCHRPNGVEGAFDARLATPLFYKNLIQQFGLSHTTPFGAKMIVPQHPEESQIWIRDKSIDVNKMPPLAKNIVDEEYIAVLTSWIEKINENEIGPCEVKYLSDLEFSSPPQNGWGPMELDLGNGGLNEKDGTTMAIAGTPFSRGLGTHAYSEAEFELNRSYEIFSAFIGVDDGGCIEGSVNFEVWTDDTLVFESGLMRYGEKSKFISIDISKANNLKLIVRDAEGGINCDHGDWADAKVQRCQQSGLSTLSRAFAFGSDDYTTFSANAPDVEYTKIIQQGDEHLYTSEKGFGYSDVSGIDPTPNKRNHDQEELYNQFIGAKDGSITFRIDIPNGDYRLIIAGGDADDNQKNHIIKVRDGSSGFYTTLVDRVRLKGQEYFKVGFNNTHIPGEDDLDVRYYLNAPKISVRSGYLEIQQSSETNSGGDICMLEVWPDVPLKDPVPRGISFGDIHIEAMPNPFREQLQLYLYKPHPDLINAEVFIYDMNGRLMFEDMQFPFNMLKPLNFSGDWSPGGYFILARAGDFRGSQKVVRQ